MANTSNGKIAKFNDTYYMGSVGTYPGLIDATLLYPAENGEMIEVARTFGCNEIIVYEEGHDDTVKEFADYFGVSEENTYLTYLWDDLDEMDDLN